MELRHLRYFTAVVEAHGFRNASRRLHVAQPALSQTVADLEAELDVRLFNRDRHAVTLTSAGEVFYRDAKSMLIQAQDAVDAAKRASKGQTSSLRIGFIPFAAQKFLPELIEAFRKQAPQVEISIKELTPRKQAEALERGELDILFTRESKDLHAAYAQQQLFDVPLVAVVPDSWVITDSAVHIRELAGERFILLDREESPPLFDSIVALCRENGFSPRFDSHANLAESLFLLVKAGEGVSIVPAWARVLRAEGVQFVRLLPDAVQVELNMVWRVKATAAETAFVNLVQERTPKIRDVVRNEFSS